MDISKWLDELGLSRYADTLLEFPIEDIYKLSGDKNKLIDVQKEIKQASNNYEN